MKIISFAVYLVLTFQLTATDLLFHNNDILTGVTIWEMNAKSLLIETRFGNYRIQRSSVKTFFYKKTDENRIVFIDFYHHEPPSQKGLFLQGNDAFIKFKPLVSEARIEEIPWGKIKRILFLKEK